MMSKNKEPNLLQSCLGNVLILALLILAGGYLYSLSQGEEEQIEYALYEVKYIHLSGETKTTRLYLDAGGINLEVGFCKGSYFIFDDAHQDLHDCNVRPLIYGATDIVSFQKIK